MNVTVAVYQRRQAGGTLVWTTLGLGPHSRVVSGKSAVKLQKELSTQLRDLIADVDPSELVQFELRRGTELRRVRLELALDGPDGKHKHSRIFPLVLEPRFRTRTERVTIAYHPDDQRSWFAVDPDRPLDDQARRFFQHTWRGRAPLAIEALATDGNDLVKAVAFRAKAKSVLDELPDRDKGPFADLEMDLERTKNRGKKRKRKKSTTLLRRLGVSVTLRAADRSAPLGRPRSPIREQLQALVGGPRKTPVVVLGPPGAGKTTALHRFASDLLEADDYWTHRNLDLVHEIWRLGGKQIIAGMSFFGQWEERCSEIVREAMHEKIVLWIDDLHTFGRMGRSAGSDRSFADFFRGPLARGEIVMIGECTEEQWARLEDDAPAFADRFTRLRLEPATPAETITLALHASRDLESELQVVFDPLALRTIVDQSAALLRHGALPGTALELTRTLAREAATRADGVAIEPRHVYEALSRRTGLPPSLIDPAKKIDPDALALELSRHVMGQPHAIDAAIDLVFRIRAGLTDTRRPYGTYLFTGPTGTGKTELAKALAGFLYGDTTRLIRFDMGEMSDYDAVARLAGDRLKPSGLLTTAVRQQPFSVILLDEIEKAHPLVLQLLLQLLDEGRLTDAAGDTADFTHAVIAMTSNLGTSSRSRVGFDVSRSGTGSAKPSDGEWGPGESHSLGRGGAAPSEKTESVEAVMSDAIRAVRDFFPPELFNRIDRVVSFAPLDPPTAGRIADKELSRLLARRGLAERNVFVFAHEGAVRRMTDRAFDARDGARSVKRYLETEIGTLLAGELAKGSTASMRIVRILAHDEGYGLHVSALVEAEPVDAEYELAGLTNAAASEIASRLPRALAIVKGLEEGAFAALAERLAGELRTERWRESRAHADALYQLDVAREELARLRDTLESHVGYGDEAEIERELAVDERRPYVDADDFRGGERSVRHLDRRWVAQKRSKIDRMEALRLVAEARFLERVVPSIESVDEHGCLLELLRVGQGRSSPGYSSQVAYGLLEWLAEFYAGFRGELVEMVARLDDGSIVEGSEALLRHPVQVVLKLSGLGTLAFFREEEGCHLWTSLLAGSDVVRVRALAAPPERSARDVIDEHLAATARFEASLDRGDPAPDPAALLPAIRKIRYEPPLRPESTAIEIEDYRMGLVESYNAPSLSEALATLSFYRMSRTR